MKTLTIGHVTCEYPDDIEFDPRAGKMTSQDLARIEKPRDGLHETCEETARKMVQAGDRVVVSKVTPQELVTKSRRAQNLGRVQNNLETALNIVRQQRLLADEDAHVSLRRVLASVRGEEKFDAGVTRLFPELIEYFDNKEPTPKTGS